MMLYTYQSFNQQDVSAMVVVVYAQIATKSRQMHGGKTNKQLLFFLSSFPFFLPRSTHQKKGAQFSAA